MRWFLSSMFALAMCAQGCPADDMVQAQDVRVPKEILKELEYLVGDWQVEGKVGDDKFTVDMSIQWAPGRHCLNRQHTWKDAKGVSYGTTVISWDGSPGGIIDSGADSHGGPYTLRYKIQSPAGWTGEITSVNPEGKSLKGQIALEKKGDKAFVWTRTKTVLDGVGQPDVEMWFTKKTPLKVQDLEWLLGVWEGEFKLPPGYPQYGPAGTTIASRCSWQWTLDKKFIVLKITDKIDGKVSGTGEEILARNQQTGALSHWWFGSTGNHGTGDWVRNGDRYELKGVGFPSRYKRNEFVAVHVRVDADTYTWQLVDIKQNGKKMPDWPKVTYRRVK